VLCASFQTVNHIENRTVSNRGYEEIIVFLNYLKNNPHVLRKLNMHHLTTRVAQATVLVPLYLAVSCTVEGS